LSLSGNRRIALQTASVVSGEKQGCSGVPANIFEPEQRSGKYFLSQPER